MRTGREELLKVLQSVSPGLATKEIIEQSSCFAFQDGRVFTFNDEVAASRESPIEINGAVKADKLLEILSKMAEDDIEIIDTATELQIKGKRKKAGIRKEEEVKLNYEDVEPADDWLELPEDFNDAVSIVHSCASTNESQFVLTCIHLTDSFIQACDRYQIARYAMPLDIDEELLVRASSLRTILGLDMTEFSLTDSWMHFRNETGLVVSCRRHSDVYIDIDQFVTKTGTTPMTLPGGLNEIVDKAQIFSSDNAAGDHVIVELSNGRVIVEGNGPDGWYKEMKNTKYDGPSLKFSISPKVLVEISKKSNECGVGEGRLFVDSGKFKFSASTETVKNEEEQDDGKGDSEEE